MLEIHEPQIEALLQQRMDTGLFASIEDALKQALVDAPLPETHTLSEATGADILAAFQRSPFRDLDIDYEAHRGPMPTRLFRFSE